MTLAKTARLLDDEGMAAGPAMIARPATRDQNGALAVTSVIAPQDPAVEAPVKPL